MRIMKIRVEDITKALSMLPSPQDHPNNIIYIEINSAPELNEDGHVKETNRMKIPFEKSIDSSGTWNILIQKIDDGNS